MEIDFQGLTMGELEDIEEATGINVIHLDPANVPLKALRGLVWIMRRRSDPSFTFEQARNVQVGELNGPSGGTPPPNAPGRGNRGATSPSSGGSRTSTASRRKLSGV